MEAASFFVDSLKYNDGLTRQMSTVTRRVVFLVIQGVVMIVVGAIYAHRIRARMGETLTAEELSERLSTMQFFMRVSTIVNGLIILGNAALLYYRYKPSSAELSLGILIKYLHLRRVIDDDLMAQLSKLKTHRIDTILL